MAKATGRVIAGLVGALALAGTLITDFEGRSLTVYPDPVTHAKPWTYCDGETQNPRIGHTYANAECDAETATRIKTLDAQVVACTRRDLPNNVRASLDSLAWNIGPTAFCKSTAAKRARAGDYKGACEAATWFNRASGRVIKGLQNRRQAEYKVCISGL